jgi:hypothetical protein
MENSNEHGTVQRNCYDWLEIDKEHRRLFVVCSTIEISMLESLPQQYNIKIDIK